MFFYTRRYLYVFLSDSFHVEFKIVPKELSKWSLKKYHRCLKLRLGRFGVSFFADKKYTRELKFLLNDIHACNY